MKKRMRFQILVTGLSLLLIVLFSQGCETIETRQPEPDPVREAITAEYANSPDEEEIDVDTIDADYEKDAARQAIPTGKVLLEYMNNETEVFRPSAYKIEFYWFAVEPVQTSQQDNSAVIAGNFKKPTYTVQKKANGRAYTRKTVKTGWYLVEFDNSGYFYKFEVMPGSDGLLTMNENNTNAPLFAGYYPSYGKIKFQFGKLAKHEDVAFLNLKKGDVVQHFWLYAQDSKNSLKNIYWFVPTGTYAFEYYSGKEGAMHKIGTLTIASGKVYPNLKL